jgi:hypothetical protein
LTFRGSLSNQSPMSHHFDSPTGREDPRINLCDLFVFAGESGSTVLIMTVNPDAGLSSPITLRPDALYEFKIDLDGDAREDLAIRFLVESLVEPPEGGPQRVKVLRAAGERARTGSDGAPLGAGGAGEVIALAGGGRAWFGLASDPFRANGPALRAFFKAIDAGRFDAAPFERQVDAFAGRNVTALVAEVPSSTLAAPAIGVWSEISLYGHAPQRRVARAAWPLIKHVLVLDEHARAHLDADPPSSDPANAGDAAIANVATVTRLAGTTADPEAYARRVASLVLPDILPYRPGSFASFGFAGINGRALGDAAYDVVFTLLANRPLAGTVPADPAANARPFPYLAAPSTLASDAKPLRAPGRRS